MPALIENPAIEAAVALIGIVLSYAVGVVIARRKKTANAYYLGSWPSWIQTTILIVIIGFTLVFYRASTKLVNFYSKSPVEKAVSKRIDVLLRETPEFEKEIRGMTPDEAKRFVMSTSLKGLARLDSDTLIHYYGLMSQLLSQGDIVFCTGIGRGTVGPMEFAEVLNRQDSKFVAAWVDVTIKALVAEFRNHPTSPVKESQIAEALQVFLTSLPKTQSDTVNAILEREDSSDEEVMKKCVTQ